MRTETASMSIDEAARYLSCSRSTIYNAVRSGEIPAIRVRSRWVIATETIERLLHPTRDAAA